MYMYIRKDVAQQLWDFGAAPPETAVLAPDPYLETRVEFWCDMKRRQSLQECRADFSIGYRIRANRRWHRSENIEVDRQHPKVVFQVQQ